MTTTSTTIKITNNSGKKVVVLRAPKAEQNATSGSSKQGYLQDLVLLDLSTGGKTLEAGSTATVTVPTTGDAGTDGAPRDLQELLISEPGSLFPVAAVLTTRDSQTGAYPDISVAPTAPAQMAMALNFCRNLMAAPTSKLAIGFVAAMREASTSDPSSIEDALDTFFAAHPPFTTIDFKSWMATNTWLQAFAYLWGMDDQGKPGRTYWIYESPFTGDSPSSLGTIKFERPANAANPADPTDHNSGFTITLAPASGASSQLGFSERLLTDSASRLALTGSFGYPTWFTSDADTPGLLPVFAGTFDSKQVIALSVEPKSMTSVLPQPAQDAFSIIGLVGSIVTLGSAIFGVVAYYKAKAQAAGAEAASAQALQQTQTALQNDMQQIQTDIGNIPPPQDFDAVANRVRDEIVKRLDQATQEHVGKAIDSLRKQLKELASIESTKQIQEAVGDLLDAQEDLTGKVGDVTKALSEVRSVTAKMPKIVENMGSRLSEELKESIEEAVESSKERTEIAEKVEEASNDTKSGEEEVKEGVPPDEL